MRIKERDPKPLAIKSNKRKIKKRTKITHTLLALATYKKPNFFFLLFSANFQIFNLLPFFADTFLLHFPPSLSSLLRNKLRISPSIAVTVFYGDASSHCLSISASSTAAASSPFSSSRYSLFSCFCML